LSRISYVIAVAAVAFSVTLSVASSRSPTTFEAVVPLIVAFAWPGTVVLLVYVFREPLERLLVLLEQRIAKGDPVSAFGVSVGVRSEVPFPVATSSADTSATKAAALEELLAVQPGTAIFVALGERPGSDESPVTGSGDALAVALVQAALLRVNGLIVTVGTVREETVFASDLLDDYSHVIGVGGPRANDLSSTLLGASYVNLEFRPGGIYDNVEHKLYRVEFSEDGLNGTDWALLAVVGNPRNAEGIGIVLAGYSGYGTNAAAAVFADPDKFGLPRRRRMEVLIRLDIASGVVRDPEIVLIRDLPSVELLPYSIS
jgi:hypothetical protein